ncbi:MAG: hypothetical protein KGI71_04940 [Patescibacteria group bacterium]|nr:hypothetical protein [Patescibacteria group bacterium]
MSDPVFRVSIPVTVTQADSGGSPVGDSAIVVELRAKDADAALKLVSDALLGAMNVAWAMIPTLPRPGAR